MAVDGTLYGTTRLGGDYYHTCENGSPKYRTCGTVFKITTSGKEAVLYSFAGHKRDGMYPEAALTKLNGILYGTTPYGGAECPSDGCGVVFAATTSGNERVLHSFKGGSDGANPFASLTVVNSVLYGATSFGGSGSCKYGDGRRGCGTIFVVTTRGTEHVIYSFKGARDGAFPRANLIAVNDTLYGTTEGGGSGYGTVFKVSLDGRERVLYRFRGGSTDGAYPAAALIELKSKLYGTTTEGGAYNCGSTVGCGTVFALTSAGKERILHSFGRGHDVGNPEAGLVNVDGVLYGTTASTVFSITPSGAETVLHGLEPGYDSLAPLVPLNGTLYGTTELGGSGCVSITAARCGTVFSISP